MSPDELAKKWKVPAYLPYVHLPLTAEVVEAAEEQLGVALPATYLAMLRVQNGGYLRGTWPEHHTHTIYGIGKGYPSLTDDSAWWRPGNSDPESWAPEGAERLIPFDGDGHTNLCFDYRVVGPRGEPTVTLVDCELATERPLADSFRAYLQGLELEGGGLPIFGPMPGDAARAIASAEGTEAVKGSNFNSGYESWSFTLADQSSRGLVRPNRVPAGFRREGRRVVTTDETALRIPEDERCTAELFSWDLDEAALRDLTRRVLGAEALSPD